MLLKYGGVMGPLRTGSPLSPPVATTDLAKSHIRANTPNTLFIKAIMNFSMMSELQDILPWYFRTNDMIRKPRK